MYSSRGFYIRSQISLVKLKGTSLTKIRLKIKIGVMTESNCLHRELSVDMRFVENGRVEDIITCVEDCHGSTNIVGF